MATRLPGPGVASGKMTHFLSNVTQIANKMLDDLPKAGDYIVTALPLHKEKGCQAG